MFVMNLVYAAVVKQYIQTESPHAYEPEGDHAERFQKCEKRKAPA